MEEDLLQAVIKVETEIQQSIESERKKAAAWLESIRVSLSRELADRKKQLAETSSQEQARICRECEKEADAAISDANRLTANLQNIPDEAMQDIVREFLPAILPPAAR